MAKYSLWKIALSFKVFLLTILSYPSFAQNKLKEKVAWKERIYYRIFRNPTFLDSVQHLDLSLQQLYNLDTLIKHCKQLRTLNISDNNIRQLVSLPYDSKLQALWAQNNLINHFDPFICNLNHLQELNLANNKLSYLPECLCNLQNLRILNLSHNPLEQLCSCFPGYAPLISIELANCQLRSVPNLLFCNPKLEKLNLSGNFLQSLPDTTAPLPALKELNLSRNYLQQVPSIIRRLVHLQVLNLSYNKLIDFSALVKLPQLKVVILKGNPLITKSQKKEIRSKLPGVKIIF